MSHIDTAPAATAFEALGLPASKLRHILDAEALNAGQLRAKYPVEIRAYDNAKHRAKKDGEDFAFETFRDFLPEVGPRLSPDLSLDRIDNGKGYVPGNVRWADKHTQTHNRSNSVKVKHEGQHVSLKKLAERTGEPYATLRSRRSRGLPPLGNSGGRASIFTWPWPLEGGERWEALYQRDHARQMMVHGYLVIYRGCRLGDRLGRVVFMLAKCQQRMAQLAEEAERIGPNDDLPGAFQRECQRWDAMRDFARQQLAAAERALAEQSDVLGAY